MLIATSARAQTTTPTSAPAVGVRCDIWYHTPPAQVEDTLAGDSLDRPPDEVRTLGDSALVPAPAVPMVASLRGWLRPALSGDYRFAVASDDSGVVMISRDQTVTGLKVLASNVSWSPPDKFDWYDSQRSAPIRLEAGRRYLFEAVVQNVDGPGHLRVAWAAPGESAFVTIPGSALEPLPSFEPLWVPPPRTPTSLVLAPDDSDAGQVAGFHRYVSGAAVQFNDGERVKFSYLLFTPGPGATSQPVTQPAPTTTMAASEPSPSNVADPYADPNPRALLVFLHGNGHQGSSLAGILNEGPASFLSRSPDLRHWFPMEGLFPELPDGWRWDTPGAAPMVNALVRAICDRYPQIDRNRIYLTGLSMGGKGSWLTVYDAPRLYAAVATFSSIAVRPTAAPRVLADVPYLHIVCGADDGDFTKGSTEMDAVLAPVLGDRLTFECVPHRGHQVWVGYYGQQSFYADLLRHHR